MDSRSEADGQPRESERREQTSAGGRRPYRQPRLVEYGSIAKLTQSQGTTLVEFGRPNSKPCL